MSALTRVRWWAPAVDVPSPYRRRTQWLLPSVGTAIWSTLERWWRRAAPGRSERALSPVERATREAAAVRAMADRYMQVDCRFAHELYCAADRHERLAELAE
ncbi:MAG: hypothetical protein U1E89_06145 [Burkholderiaceae bacterium]